MRKRNHPIPSRRTPVLFLLFLATYFSRGAAVRHDVVSLPALDFFRLQSVRTGFTNIPARERDIVLLQEDGSVETVKTFLLELPEGVSPEDVSFIQTCSNKNVLNITDNTNMLISSSPGVMNVTGTFSFDEMVGKCDYTLTAIRKTSEEIISSVTVKFIIVGMSFFTEPSPGNFAVVSGSGNKYSLSYEETVNRTVAENHVIKVLIQYPDGSSSNDFTGTRVPHGESLLSTVSGLTAQFSHNETECNFVTLGTMSQNGSLLLPPGCGYGFYYDQSGNLCFGVHFEPYRSGHATIQFSWPGITSTFSPLSTEVLEFSFNVWVTGTPPVAIVKTVPSHGFLRPEGGQLITLEVINADLHNISSYHIEVHNVTHYFNMIPGSFHTYGAPRYSQGVSFISEEGYGNSLNWTLVYQVDILSNGQLVQVYEDAVCDPATEHVFTFDTQSLRIDSVEPSFGSDDGGQDIVVTGYFPFFDPSQDGLYFSGKKLHVDSIKSFSNETITISSPKRSELGASFEYDLTVRMGRGVSNSKLFFFPVRNAQVRVSQTGTSEIDEETYRIGACTPARFTAIVAPFTNQIQSYQWSFYAAGDPQKSNILLTSKFEAVNASAQTLELIPSTFEVGAYILKIEVTLVGEVLETDLLLMREEVISIGAFILKPPERTIAFPETPLRLSAVVRPPQCYVGSQTMIFEWEAFGEVQRFSSANATGKPIEGHLTATPARLGWEYVVPQESLTPGNHTVVFRVWMEEQDTVAGQAMTHVYIEESPVIAVIRHGEERLTVNHLSTLNVYGTFSYDPDIFSDERYSGLTYEWQCRQSSTTNFTLSASEDCSPALLPNNSAPSFVIAMNVVEAFTEVGFIRYNLIVRKGMSRASETKTLIVEIRGGGRLPHLDDYSLLLTNAEGSSLDWQAVAYYDQTILQVLASVDTTWTYELLQPETIDFFSPSNLINNPLFYSVEANLYSVSGNTKPLGIESWKLDPYTTYRFKIIFAANQNYDATEVIVSMTTTEALIVVFPVPSITNGTTETTFTATAGLPTTRSTFSYYFILTDTDGYEFCLGGCTGYDVIHFQIGRPGNYSLSAYVFDMQGKALLDAATLPRNITVHPSGLDIQYRSELDVMFAQGNDHCWTQLAHDLALILLQPQEEFAEIRSLTDASALSPSVREDVLAARMEYASYISNGTRKIYCSAFPNSYHGRDCISFAYDLAKQSLLEEATVYNILQTVECCIKNTPLGTINKMGPVLPAFLSEMSRLATNLYHGGNTRRRLLNSDVTPANAFADVQNWTSSQMFKSVVSGKFDGFAAQHEIGYAGEYGHVSVVVASNPAQLPAKVVNGQLRSIVMGPSNDELFFPRDKCLLKVFSAQADKRIYFVFHSVENFIEMGFQDAPLRSNLADRIYMTQIFERDENGVFSQIEISEEDSCFCWRLPVLRRQAFLEASVDDMPGLYAVSNFKEYGEPVSEKGTKYTYLYTGSKTSDYNASEGWMEGCREDVGLVGSTIVSKTTANVIVDENGRILGTGVMAIVGLVVGGLMFVVVAMAASWILAVRAMSGQEAPVGSVVPNELYVERDVYGRGTIFDVNAVNLRSVDQ